MIRLYVSGSVTGRDNRNLDAFREAQRALADAGYTAVIPHQLVPPSAARDTAMLLCLHDLTACSVAYRAKGRIVRLYDGVALLPGWEQSEGARLEKAVAEACGIPCKTVGEWLEACRE